MEENIDKSKTFEYDHDMKTFRSLIKKYFPIELMIEINKITESYDIDNNTKGTEINLLLDVSIS